MKTRPGSHNIPSAPDDQSGAPTPSHASPVSGLTLNLGSLAALANRMSDGVGVLSAAERILYANPTLRALLGRSKAEMVGQRIVDFLQEGEAAGPGVFPVGGPPRICQWRRADGAVFEARCALEPLAGAEPGATLLLMVPTALPDQTSERDEDSNERVAAARWVEVIEAVADVTLTRLPPNDLMEAMLNRIRPALGLENAAVFLLTDAGDALEASVVAGPGRELGHGIRVPLTGPLVSGLFHTREPVVVNGATARLRASGLFPERLLQSMNVHSMLLTPLIVEDQVTGMLYLGAPAVDHFTVDDIRLARVASARVALAVEGARAREAEANAREEMARAQRRLVMLAEASSALVGPLDPTLIATRLVSLVAPAYADASALYLVEDDGMVRRVAVSGPAAEEEGGPAAPAYAAVQRALERLPLEMASLDLPPEAEASQPGVRKGAAGRLDSASLTRVLVESHGHAVGALFLIEGTGRLLAPDDLTLAQGLALRAAVGMEIARLYAEVEDTLRQVSDTAMQLDTVFDATDACIFVTNARGHFQRINAYGARMLGLGEGVDAPTNAQLRAAFELRDERGAPIPPDELPLTITRTRNMTVERRVIVHRLIGEHDVPALARCAPLRDGRGKVTGVVGVMMDITGINQIERQKDEFLGILSHELKTPLTTLKILSQMLARRMRQSEEPRALEQAERMTNAIVRMERLITDLLDLSRIQEGKLTMTMTVSDLGAICRDAAREQEIISSRQIQLALPEQEELPIHADTERLWQVVVNLLSNALKYSPANTPVALRARESGDMYLVSVEDHGPGLPQEERRHIFQRFYRAPSVQVQSGSGVGLGLGLFISREIVTAHGGEIWVESKPGHGSVFTFSIPRATHAGARDAS
ncbi:MAG TPA: ATP-binding protein [Ktedonobacterales bacterium]